MDSDKTTTAGKKTSGGGNTQVDLGRLGGMTLQGGNLAAIVMMMLFGRGFFADTADRDFATQRTIATMELQISQLESRMTEVIEEDKKTSAEQRKSDSELRETVSDLKTQISLLERCIANPRTCRK